MVHSHWKQEGGNIFPRHVYANPISPEICPILALGLVLACTSYRAPDRFSLVFEGDSDTTESKFGKWLRTLSQSSAVSPSLRLVSKDIGSHSLRKGVITYASGSFCGINAIQIHLRAGWSLGNVQDRYCSDIPGGDQQVGRVSTGLPQTSERFCVLPAHFKPAELPKQELMPEFFYGYENYPKTFQGVMPYLIASLLFHESFLLQQLPRDHPYFRSPLWLHAQRPDLRTRVIGGGATYQYEHMEPTGVPSHILILRQSKSIETCVKEMKASLPHDIGTWLMEHAPAVQTAVTREEFLDGLGRVISLINEGRNLPTNAAADESPNSVDTVHSWGGRLHPVPESFVFPMSTVKELFDGWHFGTPVPYKKLKKYDIPVVSQRAYLCRARTVMKALDECANLDGCTWESMPRLQREQEYCRTFRILLSKLYGNFHETTAGTITYITIYNKIVQKK